MLPKTYRLDTDSFKDFYKHSKKYTYSPQGGGVMIDVYIGKEGGGGFGIVCSKKVCGTSVERNRIRRIIYSEIEKHIPVLSKIKRTIFVIKKYNGEEKYLREGILSLLKSTCLLKENK